MQKFTRNLLTEWRKMGLPFSNETIVVAVSGGADSVSLALALSELKSRKKLELNFIIAHFNHRLRGDDSDNDAEFVREFAEKLQFISEIRNSKFNIEDSTGNLEQNARDARYQFLLEVAEEHNACAILTAHTQNDQAETLLINLIRGSGLDGLAGIRSERKLKGIGQGKEVLLIRPLINLVKRNDTEEFCIANKIQVRHDSMNDDPKFSRVRVRKEIIPLLKKINPKIIETLSQTANLLRDDAEILSESLRVNSDRLSQNDLRILPKARRLRTLREWLKNHRGNLRQLELKHLEAIERLALSQKSGREIELPNGERVVKKDGFVIFEKTRVEKSVSDN